MLSASSVTDMLDKALNVLVKSALSSYIIDIKPTAISLSYCCNPSLAARPDS